MANFDFKYTSILSGIQELSEFSRIYFSKQNIDWLQLNIRYSVYKASGDEIVIGNQSEQELLLVMRGTYLQYSNNPSKTQEYKKEIMKLNKVVIDEVTPKILKEAIQYQRYLKESLKNPVPVIDRPVNMSSKGVSLNGSADALGLDTLRQARQSQMVGFRHFV